MWKMGLEVLLGFVLTGGMEALENPCILENTTLFFARVLAVICLIRTVEVDLFIIFIDICLARSNGVEKTC